MLDTPTKFQTLLTQKAPPLAPEQWKVVGKVIWNTVPPKACEQEATVVFDRDEKGEGTITVEQKPIATK